jgi:hypothetical protein
MQKFRADTRDHCNKDVTMAVRSSARRMSQFVCGKQKVAMCSETERAIDVIASELVALKQGSCVERMRWAAIDSMRG